MHLYLNIFQHKYSEISITRGVIEIWMIQFVMFVYCKTWSKANKRRNFFKERIILKLFLEHNES